MSNNDNIHYKLYYDWAANGTIYQGFEGGYMLISSWFTSHGFTFLEFRYIFITFFTILLYISVRSITEKVGWFYVFYFLYEIFRDAEQIRFFAATAIVYCGIFVLVNEKLNKFWKIIIYSTVIYLASTIHRTALLFIVLLLTLVPEKYHKKIIRLLAFLSFSVLLLVLVDRSLLEAILIKVFKEGGKFYTAVSSHFGFLFPTAIFTVTAFIFRYMEEKLDYSDIISYRPRHHLEKLAIINTVEAFDYSTVFNIVSWLTTIALTTIPLLAINNHFYRLGRSVFEFSMIAFPEYYCRLSKSDKSATMLVVLLCIVLYFVFDFFMTGSIAQQYLTLFIN